VLHYTPPGPNVVAVVVHHQLQPAAPGAERLLLIGCSSSPPDLHYYLPLASYSLPESAFFFFAQIRGSFLFIQL
jgi:hypothetical protein